MSTTKKDWSKVKIRCHALGMLLTAAKDKAKKDAGEFGATAEKQLIRIYALEKWGREEKLVTDPIQKGIIQEGLGIELINRVEGETFVKNEERLDNEFITGIPDMFKGKNLAAAKLIGDNKCAYTAQSFLENEITELKKIYRVQMNGYCDLSGSKKAAVYFTLVSAPETMILKWQNKLKWDMGVIDESVNSEYRELADDIRYQMTFEDIPETERLIKIEVEREDELIEEIHDVVVRARKWLAEFDAKRLARYK